jgi:Tfp pilus assembly protein PilZ
VCSSDLPGTGGCTYTWSSVPAAAASNQLKIKIEEVLGTSISSSKPTQTL